MRECQLCKHCYSDTVTTCPTDGLPTSHTIPGEPVLEGKYHLDLRIGQGGMGVVYKARHAYLKTLLAIKIILPDLVGNDPELVTRFRQEALAAAAIRHMNVVAVTDYGVVAGSLPFLVMEYVEGESLHDLLAREKRLSPERALDLMSPICAGVGAAHHQGIVHRDLKPLNVMICSDKPTLSQAVKILDFGLAKIKSGELLGSFIQAQTTGLMGSPYYMAPEQWADEEPDSRADIYSLGVMLYQMLAGDVPFKGSSIPAIMKKHISDPPPAFSVHGLNLPPALERAVLHTLEKDPAKRTASVEMLIEEMTEAIHPAAVAPSIHSTLGQSLPVSSLKIRTRPPASKVFIDNVAVGETTPNGEMLLEGIQSGNHHLRVSKPGFHDWLGDVVCDGLPREVVAELRTAVPVDADAIPKPAFDSMPSLNSEVSISPLRNTPVPVPLAETVQLNQLAATGGIAVTTVPPKKKFLSPLVLGIGAILVLFVIGIIGVGSAFYFGVFGPVRQTGNLANNIRPTPGTSPVAAKAEMVSIPGGTFKMGRNDGAINERPEHLVKVDGFAMDKTEVTNAEYAQFVAETNHIAPKHWSNNRPIPGTEMRPVAYVGLDDAMAFAEWRSKRDGVNYRLPTEEEWEYAARNGSKDTLYPWGDEWADAKAVMAVADSEPTEVGSKPDGKNSFGVLDLIGNVWEWTSTELNAYPGSNVEIQRKPGKRIIVRGGSANENPSKLNITSTFRVDVASDQKEKNIGFRLVRPG
jgi:eukaryotic-like serine/threonine-protein kinase